MSQTTCIKCGLPCDHSICESCADKLLDSYSSRDQVAFALLGMDVMSDNAKGIIRPKGYLKERYEQYKKELKG